MSSPTLSNDARPGADEYAPYFEKYVSLVPAGDIVETLSRQSSETLALLKGLAEERGGFRYEPGKWSVKQVVGHITDAERVFAYRALSFARGDATPLPGFDQDVYAAGANFDSLPLSQLVEEFASVRASTLSLFRSLGPEAWARRGTANDNAVSVRALAHMIAGHELHHVGILRERYLK